MIDPKNKIIAKKSQISGVRDFFGIECEKRASIVKNFAGCMTRYGYTPIETSILNSADLYSRTAGETSDIVLKELYFATNAHSEERDVALRPEGTTAAINATINLGKSQEANLKMYYSGPMFRHNRPQKGRYRQHTQLGAEVLNPSKLIIAESIICLAELLNNWKINFVLDLNILPQKISPYVAALRDFFEANLGLLTETSRDTLARNPLRVLDKVSQDSRFTSAPKSVDFLTEQESEDFQALLKALDAFGIKYNLNANLVRGLDYYVGPVFECIVDKIAIAGGGGYVIRGQDVGVNNDIYGIGWGIGLERVFDLAELPLNRKIVLVVTSLNEDEYALQVAQTLRSHGFTVTLCDNLNRGRLCCSKLTEEGHKTYLLCVGDQEKGTNSVSSKEWNVDTKPKTVRLVDLVSTISSMFGH